MSAEPTPQKKGAMNSGPQNPEGGLPRKRLTQPGEGFKLQAPSPAGMEARGRSDLLSPQPPPGEMPGLQFYQDP